MRDDVPNIRHVLECIRCIEENVAGGKSLSIQASIL
jgi:hypothetical protein